MNTTETLSFGQAISWQEVEPGVTRGRVTPDWGQGRSTFGGLVAAIALRQMQRQVNDDRQPLSLSVTFVGPLRPGEGICRTRVLRAGKDVTLVEARIEQNAEPCCVANGVFARARDSIVRVEPREAPPLPLPDSIPANPYVEGAMPVFLQHLRTRWGYGNPPFSGLEITPIGGYCELIGEPDRANACRVVALLDAWPPPAFAPHTTLVNASTITWTVDFITDTSAREYRGPFRYEGSIAAASGGHVQENAWLWDADGHALVRSTQLVSIYG
jgi:acyl-CoA thioesterase